MNGGALRRNPALWVVLIVPVLSVVVACTFVSVAIQVERDSADAVAAQSLGLPALSKTSWREPVKQPVVPELPAPLQTAPKTTPESTPQTTPQTRPSSP